MLTRSFLTAILAALLTSCTSAPKPSAEPPSQKPATATPPRDESRRFPEPNLVSTRVVATTLLGKPFMPGGTLAHYKKGKAEYDMFLARLPTATDAAILLPDWRLALTDAKLVPSFGGYFGLDGGRSLFVFAKGPWIAGIAGLPLQDADLQARTLASHLNP